MSIAPARRSALRVLARVRRDAAFGGAVLTAELERGRLSPDDAALATRLVYGVLGTEGVLDEAIDAHLKGPVEPRIRDILRLAAYESLFGRAPAYAVVDQAVSAARTVRPQAAGLVNAVSRRVAEQADGFPWGDPATDLDALSRASACPRWVVDEFLASLGHETGTAALLACADVAPTYVRMNPFAASPADTVVQLGPARPRRCPPDPDCFELEAPAAAFSGGPSAGWFSMDAAAQMAPRACGVSPGERVLDVGAGRGNKTVCLQAIASRAGGTARIVALEVNAGKTARLDARLAVSGVPDVETVTGDAAAAHDAFGGDAFDCVLLDAPCTGLGTLRRYPEKRWRLTPGDASRMSEVQSELLAEVSRVVRPGGRVVYSTCSVSRVENGGVVDRFLGGDAGSGFAIEPIGPVLPPEWGTFLGKDGTFQSWPSVGGPDGHYVAVLRRGLA